MNSYPSLIDGITFGLLALLFGGFLWLYHDQKREIRFLQEQLEEQEKPAPMQLPMPGIMIGRIKVTRLDVDDDDAPEWVKELFADPAYPGPIPTFEELEESLFAEIERMGVKIPD